MLKIIKLKRFQFIASFLITCINPRDFSLFSLKPETTLKIIQTPTNLPRSQIF